MGKISLSPLLPAQCAAGALTRSGVLNENDVMVDEQKKFDAANASVNPPEELYAVAEPDPDLIKSRPAMEPIIPEVIHEGEPRESRRSVGERLDFESFRQRFHFQFTLADLFILTTATAVLLSIMRLVAWKWQYAAGLGGVGAFISLAVITYVEPERRIAQTIWWSILTFYLLACLAAVVTGG